jgi:hypothetical protein
MKFEIYLLHRSEIYVKYVDVPSVISFFARSFAIARSYSVMAHRGEKAIFIEKVTDLVSLNKKLTEFMVATSSQQ